jgi:hypothetical protein
MPVNTLQPVNVLISSRNRPIYLWTCLDALYRHTHYPHRFHLVDMASDDPAAFDVISSFERRRMFEQVVHAEENDPQFMCDLILAQLDAWGPYFVYMEGDAIIEAGEPCWLSRMVALMESHPRLAMLGSAIDKSDFVDPEEVDYLRGARAEGVWRALIKADSPERLQSIDAASGAPLFRPHNPAGRLLLLRTDALRDVGLAEDYALDAKLRAAGWETGIAAQVRHRHLSLIQIFDYPDYDIEARHAYMRGENVASALQRLSPPSA